MKRKSTPDGKKYTELGKTSKRVPKSLIKNRRKGMEKPRKREEKPVTRSWLKSFFSGDEEDEALEAANNPEQGDSLSDMLKKSGWSGDDSNMW